MITKITHEQAKHLIDNENAVLIDVREEEEFAVNHASGAVLLPVDSIDEDSAKQIISDKTDNVIVYCRSGNRSALAATRLDKLGYTNLYDAGSLAGWPYGLSYGIAD